MQNGLVSFDEAVSLLSTGRYFTVAADEALLRKLPAGHWIGGSTPYFVGQEGGESSREKVFITELPTLGDSPEIRFYTPEQLPRVFLDAPENGFSLIIIPAFSQAHLDFARHAPDYEEAFLKPLTGWISGMHLDDLSSAQAMVANGQQREFSNVAAVVMHVPLPDDKLAEINIVNLFHPGQGPAIRFPSTGFTAGDCLIDGHPANLADYLLAQNADTSVPLVADYCGAMINVSIKGIDAATHSVAFYAPVFEDMEYRIADPVNDYVAAFAAAMPAGGGRTAFSCNCILNYLHSDLEGKRTGALAGPVTFGEVAYQLLNQTLVYMTIE